jgi:hypothetical protein
MVQGCQEFKYSQKMLILLKNKVNLLTFLPKLGILNLTKFRGSGGQSPPESGGFRSAIKKRGWIRSRKQHGISSAVIG